MKKIARIAFSLICMAGIFDPARAAKPTTTGEAKGMLMTDGQSFAITHATAFIDQREEDKPIILILTNQKVPAETWTSEFDLMRYEGNFSGVLFWIKKGRMFRSDLYVEGRQSSLSGIFELKLEKATNKEVAGSAVSSSPTSANQLAVTFHVTLR